MSAKTDSKTTIVFDKTRKGLYNLLTIYKVLSGKSEKIIEKKFKNKGYGDFKRDLAELIVRELAPIQKKIETYMKDKKKLDKILATGAKKAEKVANKTLRNAKKKIGLVV